MHEPLKDTSVFYMLCFSASQSTLRIGDFGENHYLWQEKCSCLTQIQFTTRINAGTIQSAYVCNGWKALKRIKFSNAWIEFWIVNRAKSEKKIHQLLTGLNRLLSCGQWWVKRGQHGKRTDQKMQWEEAIWQLWAMVNKKHGNMTRRQMTEQVLQNEKISRQCQLQFADLLQIQCSNMEFSLKIILYTFGIFSCCMWC